MYFSHSSRSRKLAKLSPEHRTPPAPLLRPLCAFLSLSRSGPGLCPLRHLFSHVDQAPLLTFHHPEDVVGIHDQVFFPLDLYLRTGIFGQDHYVPGAHLNFVGGSHRDDLSRLRLLPGCVGEDDPASRLLLAFDHLDECPRPKRLQLHLLTSCVALIARHKVTLDLRSINKRPIHLLTRARRLGALEEEGADEGALSSPTQPRESLHVPRRDAQAFVGRNVALREANR